MKIEIFKETEWLEIADVISLHCPSEPIIEKLISEINNKTNLFSITHEFFIKNNINPVFFAHRNTIEKLKGGKGLTKRLSTYSSSTGKGIVAFKKDYQKYILNKYVIIEKKEEK